MPGASASVPAESDLLCESCGYTLNGLSQTTNCPECGRPVAETTDPNRRHPPAWEGPGWIIGRFLITTIAVIFRPTRFYRSMTTRGPVGPARAFARIHWFLAAALYATAAFVHTNFYTARMLGLGSLSRLWWIAIMIATYLILWGTTSLAARLTTWEAAYRGYRLPLPVVLRGLYYHAAHFLPVGILAAVTVVGYQMIRDHQMLGLTAYLYLLCAEVVIAAGYLFQTYWIGMKATMYANR
jgi:hypothetical protein